MEQRIQVYHNYISAVFNLKHKRDIINRLKRVEPHNISTYKAKMTRHIELHEDVLGRLLTNLKQDNYFRSLEDLLTIDSLQAYDDVQLFPELYNTTAVIEQITSEVDLIERQLKRPGMYLYHLHHYPQFQVSSQGHLPHSNPYHPRDSQQSSHHNHQTNHRRTTALEHHQAIHYLVAKAHLRTQPVRLMNPQVGHHSTQPNKYYHSLTPHQQHPLVDHKLICQLSLSFQLLQHPRMCPAHHSRTFQSPSMVKE